MPIKVTCKCGKSFAAKEQLAGKAVKCPNCSQPIRIPQPKQKPAAGRPPAAPAPGGIGDLLDEVGMGGHTHDDYTGPRCPSCDAPLAQHAALCVECGYNLQSGKFVKGMGQKSKRGPQKAEGYEGAAQDLLSKAERALKEAPSPTDRGEKESWYVPYVTAAALIAVAGVGFLLWMGFSKLINMPEEAAEGEAAQLSQKITYFAAFGMWGLGSLVMFVATIMIAVHAFRHGDTVHGILSLLISLYAPIYACFQRGRLDRELKTWALGLYFCLSALCPFFFGVLKNVLSLPPVSLGLTIYIMLLALMFVAGVLLMFAGWVYSLVAAFMERVYHGILAILYPFYGATFCIARRDEHPVGAKLWLGGAACLIASVVLYFLGIIVIFASAGDLSIADRAKGLGLFALIFIGIPVGVMLIIAGLICAAVGLHNVMFASEKKHRLSIPGFGSATFMGMELTGSISVMGFTPVVLLVAALMAAFSAIGGAVGAVLGLSFYLLLLHFTPVFFSVADMISFQRGIEYRRGMIVSGIFCVLWLITVVTTIIVLAFTIGLIGMLAEVF